MPLVIADACHRFPEPNRHDFNYQRGCSQHSPPRTADGLIPTQDETCHESEQSDCIGLPPKLGEPGAEAGLLQRQRECQPGQTDIANRRLPAGDQDDHQRAGDAVETLGDQPRLPSRQHIVEIEHSRGDAGDRHPPIPAAE